jgi:dTDP-4-dehydrorhamnose reductase
LILITGGSGLLGSALTLTTLEHGLDAVAVCCRHPVELSVAQIVVADLRNRDVLVRLLRNHRPDWIVHCAAQTDVDWCEEHPDEAWETNVAMTRNIAIEARRMGVGLVYISTDSVFSGERGGYSETDSTGPVNVYARSKLEGEKVACEEWKRSVVIRTNLYGLNVQEKSSLAEWIVQRLESELPVPAFPDVIFTPILANDLSEVILEFIEKDLAGLFHVGGSQVCSKYEFALAVAEVFGLDRRLVEPTSITVSSLTAPRPRDTSLKSEKATKVLGRPLPDLRKGLSQLKALRESGFYATFRKNRAG